MDLVNEMHENKIALCHARHNSGCANCTPKCKGEPEQGVGLLEDIANAAAQLVQSSDARFDSEDLICLNCLDGSF